MRKYALIIILSVFVGCKYEAEDSFNINDSHLNYLYREINVQGTDMAVINIYSNYPDYKYVGDDDEGFACVDDASRAGIYYLRSGILNKDEERIRKNKMLVRFLMYMQADNGYFYNFIWDDYSINKDFKTSVAQPNWWSWRALWTLSESYSYYKNTDTEFADQILMKINKLIDKTKENIKSDKEYINEAGISIPNWFPARGAADQASVLLLGLNEYYGISHDEVILDYIKSLCEGIMDMQIKDDSNQFNGAFLSWMNTWHAWGNLQSYALLKSYNTLKDEKILGAVLNELNGFYDQLIAEGYINSFKVAREKENIESSDMNKFSQIAYNIRPMVFALMEAFRITHDEKYAEKAGTVAAWFFGNNAAGVRMYNPDTGIIYDGINSDDDVNKNSGAESTIEALLSLLEIKNNKRAVEALNIK